MLSMDDNMVVEVEDVLVQDKIVAKLHSPFGMYLEHCYMDADKTKRGAHVKELRAAANGQVGSAEKSGLVRAGYIIESVDNINVTKTSFDAILEMLKDLSGSKGYAELGFRIPPPNQLSRPRSWTTSTAAENQSAHALGDRAMSMDDTLLRDVANQETASSTESAAGSVAGAGVIAFRKTLSVVESLAPRVDSIIENASNLLESSTTAFLSTTSAEVTPPASQGGTSRKFGLVSEPSSSGRANQLTAIRSRGNLAGGTPSSGNQIQGLLEELDDVKAKEFGLRVRCKALENQVELLRTKTHQSEATHLDRVTKENEALLARIQELERENQKSDDLSHDDSPVVNQLQSDLHETMELKRKFEEQCNGVLGELETLRAALHSEVLSKEKLTCELDDTRAKLDDVKNQLETNKASEAAAERKRAALVADHAASLEELVRANRQLAEELQAAREENVAQEERVETLIAECEACTEMRSKLDASLAENAAASRECEEGALAIAKQREELVLSERKLKEMRQLREDAVSRLEQQNNDIVAAREALIEKAELAESLGAERDALATRCEAAESASGEQASALADLRAQWETERSNLCSKLEMQRKKVEQATENLQATLHKLETMRQNRDDLEDAHNRVVEELAVKHAELTEVQELLASAEARCGDMDREAQQVTTSSEDLKRELLVKGNELETANQELEHARQELENLKAHASGSDAAADVELRKRAEELENQRAELAAARSDAVALTQELERKSDDLSAAVARQAELSGALSESRREVEELVNRENQHGQVVDVEVANLKAANSELVASRESVRLELEAARGNVVSLETQLEHHKVALAESKVELCRAHNEHVEAIVVIEKAHEEVKEKNTETIEALRDSAKQWREKATSHEASESQMLERVSDLETAKAALLGQVRELEASEARLSESEAGLRSSLSKLQEQLDDLVTSEAQLRGSEAKLREAEAHWHETEAQLRESEAGLRASQSQLRDQIGDLEQSKSQLRESEARLLKSESQLRESEALLQEKVAGLEAKASHLEVKIEELENTSVATNDQATPSSDALEARCQKLEAEVASAHAEVEQTKKKCEEDMQGILETQMQYQEVLMEYPVLKGKFAAVRRERDSLRSTRESEQKLYAERVQQLLEGMNKLKTRCASLEAEREELALQVANTKELNGVDTKAGLCEKDWKRECEGLRKDLELAHVKVTQAEANLVAKVQALEDLRVTSEREAESIRAECRLLSAKHLEIQGRCGELEDQLKQKHDEASDKLPADLDTRNADMEELQAGLETGRMELQNVQADLEKRDADLATAVHTIRKLEGQVARGRAVEHQLNGDLGELRDALAHEEAKRKEAATTRDPESVLTQVLNDLSVKYQQEKRIHKDKLAHVSNSLRIAQEELEKSRQQYDDEFALLERERDEGLLKVESLKAQLVQVERTLAGTKERDGVDGQLSSKVQKLTRACSEKDNLMSELQEKNSRIVIDHENQLQELHTRFNEERTRWATRAKKLERDVAEASSHVAVAQDATAWKKKTGMLQLNVASLKVQLSHLVKRETFARWKLVPGAAANSGRFSKLVERFPSGGGDDLNTKLLDYAFHARASLERIQKKCACYKLALAVHSPKERESRRAMSEGFKVWKAISGKPTRRRRVVATEESLSGNGESSRSRSASYSPMKVTITAHHSTFTQRPRGDHADAYDGSSLTFQRGQDTGVGRPQQLLTAPSSPKIQRRARYLYFMRVLKKLFETKLEHKRQEAFRVWAEM